MGSTTQCLRAAARTIGVSLAFALVACGGSGLTQRQDGGTPPPTPGTSDFVSAPLNGSNSRTATDNAGAADASVAASDSGASPTADGGTTSTRQVEETDIYRVDGNRLYYLNGYRGLMVFDITDPDHPALLGSAPVYGSPVEMLVRNGIAYVIIADWYGFDGDEPFYGSLVRAFDATDAAHITTGSEVHIQGWIRDARVVGDVLYAVSQDWGYEYFYGGYSQPEVSITSVNIASPLALSVAGSHNWTGYDGIFNVTANAVLMAHNAGYYGSGAEIDYIDISDPAGTIRTRGSIVVPGSVNGWSANNGRFNIDYDGRYVRVLADAADSYTAQFSLSTIDANDPDHLVSVGQYPIAATEWSPTARFDSGRMYLSPDSWSDVTTPVQIYDVSTPTAAPNLMGQTAVPGSVWNFIPAGNRLFALGSEYGSSSNAVSLSYLDVTNASAPTLIGTSAFSAGWAWSPATNDFKAFTYDPTRGLVVLPFSSWDETSDAYHTGLQLIDVGTDSISTAGTAFTHGWVERGIFVANRLYALSDLSLGVVDYTDHANPVVTNELTLARNIVDAEPNGTTIAEVSGDWWGNPTDAQLRILPVSDANDSHLTGALSQLNIHGTGPTVYANGNYVYVLTSVASGGTSPYCYYCGGYNLHLTVVDISAPGGARIRSEVDVPLGSSSGYGYYWGWYGWWDTRDVVQVEGSALAIRDYGTWSGSGYTGSRLVIADLSNPDAPNFAWTSVAPETDDWWGNLVAVHDQLFTTHYEWVSRGTGGAVRYFLDQYDLSDRAHPRIARSVNIPGVFVGASDDLRTIYTIDFQWRDDYGYYNTFDSLALDGHATLLSAVNVDGWIGRAIVRDRMVYFSSENWSETSDSVQLHALDLTNPSSPIDRTQSTARSGWLFDVEGDRAIVQSNWGQGVEIYRLSPSATPVFERFQRMSGWGAWSVSRQNDTLFFSTGDWGVQTLDLTH